MALAIALALAISAVLSLLRLCLENNSYANNYIGTRASDIAHTLMNGTMSVMLTPFYTPAVAHIVLVIYCGVGISFSLRIALRSHSAKESSKSARMGLLATDFYHLFATLAMIFVLLTVTTSIRRVAALSPDGARMSDAIEGPALRTVAKVLEAVFTADAVAITLVALFYPQAFRGAPARNSSVECASSASSSKARLLDSSIALAAPHLMMDVGMIWMLLTM